MQLFIYVRETFRSGIGTIDKVLKYDEYYHHQYSFIELFFS